MKLYNTLTKKVEEFTPLHKDHINMYTCGPTVYNYAHIGNLRSYIMADLLYRSLKFIFPSHKVHWVMNITDIDDKTIKGTLGQYGKDAGVNELYKFTEKYLENFKADLKEVNALVEEIDIIRVTDKMLEIQEFVINLMQKGYAYKAEDGVYFSIEKYQKDFGDYGELVGEKFLEGKKVGARVAVDEYEKDNLSDFVLWKAWDKETDGNIFWEHPQLGKGRPGWHIECSVINRVAFGGEATDIHTGGVDLVFPHHTNEIAQSQPFYKPFSRFWYHNEHLLVDGGRMGKRFNNFYTVKDLKEKGFSGQDLRYFFLNSSFTSQQNFTLEGLASSRTAKEKLLGLMKSDNALMDFKSAIQENLNFPKALASVWEGGGISELENSVLGFKVDEVADLKPEIQELVDQRQQAKNAKDYKKSDELRKQIEDLGYEVMDTPDGQKVKKKINF
jgi:cysteinyl-tRNA synthetase